MLAGQRCIKICNNIAVHIMTVTLHISDDRLREVIEDVRKDHPNMGEIMILGHLRSRQINVQRHRVRHLLEQIDPEGLRRRRS
jgi:hypothetical protein